MTEQSIRPLLLQLETAGTLVQIGTPVARQHLAALAWQARNRHGKAIAFSLVGGHVGWRAASQLLAERAQWAAAFGIAESELLFALRERLRTARAPVEVATIPVRAVRADGERIDLARVPVPLWCTDDTWPRLGGVLILRDPDSGKLLLGLSEHHILTRNRTGVGGLPPALRALQARARAAGKPLQAALVVGGHPALYLAAALAELLPGADLALAGGLLDAPIEVATIDGIGVPVPAAAELVIGGTLVIDDEAELPASGGLLGVHGGAGKAPVFHATALLHRGDPVCYAMQLGAPRNDHTGMVALATELLVAEHIRHIEGGLDLIDVRCHGAAGGLVLVVKLRGRVEGQTKTALVGALSGPPIWPKLAIAVDEDVDATDLRDVFWSAASRTHAAIDVGMIDGVRAHPDDPAALLDARTGERTGTRWFIDSTMPPLTQPERRLAFARAIPKNLADTPLGDFLPKG